VDGERLGHLVADGLHRVERRHRFLEDHRDVVAAQAHQSASGWSRRGLPSRRMVPGGGRAVGQEAHQRERRHGFARAAFADKAEDLAPRDVERDVRRMGVPWMVTLRRSISIMGAHRIFVRKSALCDYSYE
jgi:hypothetical protein